jgi:hypothetical protein
MLIYIFSSETHTAVSALTSDHSGGNLPPVYAPWRPVNGGRALPVSSQASSVIGAIQRDGYFLLSAKTVRSAE